MSTRGVYVATFFLEGVDWAAIRVEPRSHTGGNRATSISAGDEGVINSGFIGCHCLRATGITAYLEHPDASDEVVQYLAGQACTEITRLYDRDRQDERKTLDEVERIGIQGQRDEQ